jgi:hypothetical protein
MVPEKNMEIKITIDITALKVFMYYCQLHGPLEKQAAELFIRARSTAWF